MDNPIIDPPQELYDPDRFDVGHWGDEEVYVYNRPVDRPEGELMQEYEMIELLDEYFGTEPYIGNEVSLSIENNMTGTPFLVVRKRGEDTPLFYTPDEKAIRYLLSLPEFLPSGGMATAADSEESESDEYL